MAENQTSPLGATLVVVGLGNIGSSLVSLVAHLRGVSEITLIDMGIYERPNLAGQLISEEDLEKPKVLVQAQRLRRLRPELKVTPIFGRIEHVALAKLRGLVLGCLDSRLARLQLAQACWRTNSCLIDAGIEPGSRLARIEVYIPGPDHACLECAWSADQYRAAALEQSYPCGDAQSGAAATNAPAALGALAASMQALECEKILAGQMDRVAVSKQVLIDTAFHRHFVTVFKRNARCRFDHKVWVLQKLACEPEEFTLGEALSLRADAAAGGAGAAQLQVEGDRFVSALTCGKCATRRFLLRLRGRLSLEERTCIRCGEEIPASGMELTESLQLNALPMRAARLPLSDLGLGQSDVFTLTGPGGEAHYEIFDGAPSGGI
jgi:molybdopterin/thiamine biosynthesis adenylyltransferase